jgi:LPXTG-site transpeptidase (sortase) family protein
MTGDAGPRKSGSRRPGSTILLVLAVLLLIGGGTAVAVGVAGQDADPPAPSASASTGSSTRVRGDATVSEANPVEVAPPAALPASVSIPAIGVESELITLGLNADGTLAVPAPGPDYDKAAWFDGSPRPGDIGPAVIEGHVDSAANGPSVFYRLGDLAVGDRVDVTRADASVVTFVVDEVRVVPKDDFPTVDVYGNTDGPELRLITCGGPFDSAAGSYEDNVVVFASLAP